MAVKKRQLFLLSGTFKVVPRGAPRGYDDGHLSGVGLLESYYRYTGIEIEKNAAMMMMSQIKAIVVLVPYRLIYPVKKQWGYDRVTIL